MEKNIITNHLINIGCLKQDSLALDILKSSIVDRLYTTNQYLTKVAGTYFNNPQYLQYTHNQKHHLLSYTTVNDLIKITQALKEN